MVHGPNLPNRKSMDPPRPVKIRESPVSRIEIFNKLKNFRYKRVPIKYISFTKNLNSSADGRSW